MARSNPTLLLRLLHSIAGGLKQLGFPQTELRADGLVAAARARTKLDDFGPEPWSKSFGQLVATYDTDPQLGPLGRVAVREYLIGLLVNRLQIEEAIRKDSGICDEVISRPVFIVGLPRTGTTWLYQLLAQDPLARPLQTWEAVHPVPPPRSETYETDPRILKVERNLKRLDLLIPTLRAIHPIAARGPEECLPLLWNAALTPYFRGRIEPYRAWLWLRPIEEFDAACWYYRRQLQLLQRHVRGDHWLLKSPAHLTHLDSLLRVFPDAIVVQTHRDPQDVLPSLCSLTATVDQLFYPSVDLDDVGSRTVGLAKSLLERQRTVRKVLPPGRIIDVGYQQLMRDPQGVVERIALTSGLNYSEEFRSRLTVLIARNQRSDRARHSYAADDFGLTPEGIDRELTDYLQEFGELCGRG